VSIDADVTVQNAKNPVTLLNDVDGFYFLSSSAASVAFVFGPGCLSLPSDGRF
jgi:hypothetical protein